MCWLLYTNLQIETHYRRLAPLARSQKSQHKYIFPKILSELENLRGWGEWNKNVLSGKESKNLLAAGGDVYQALKSTFLKQNMIFDEDKSNTCVHIQKHVQERNYEKRVKNYLKEINSYFSAKSVKNCLRGFCYILLSVFVVL